MPLSVFEAFAILAIILPIGLATMAPKDWALTKNFTSSVIFGNNAL